MNNSSIIFNIESLSISVTLNNKYLISSPIFNIQFNFSNYPKNVIYIFIFLNHDVIEIRALYLVVMDI